MSSPCFCHDPTPKYSAPSRSIFLNPSFLKSAEKLLPSAKIRNCLQRNWKIPVFWNILMFQICSTCKGTSFSHFLFIPSTIDPNSLSASTFVSPRDQPWFYYRLRSSTPNGEYLMSNKIRVGLCIWSDTWDWPLQWYLPCCDQQS